MGAIIKSSQFNKEMLKKISTPIVLCSFAPRLKKIFTETGYKELSLNKMLAEALFEKESSDRPQFVSDEAIRIITSLQDPILLTDYEILFDPRCCLDVIRFFYELSRRVKIVIKWCGTLEDDRLVYATPDHIDFHSFNICDYDITCVI